MSYTSAYACACACVASENQALPLLKNLALAFNSTAQNLAKGDGKVFSHQSFFLLRLPPKPKHPELKLKRTDNIDQDVFGLTYSFLTDTCFTYRL